MNKQELIEKCIMDLVSNNALSEGDRVFSIREMAKMHHTSVTPVIAAYQHLEMLGILQSRPKSGFYVAQKNAETNKTSVPPYAVLFDIDGDEQSRLRDQVSLLVHDPSIKYSFAPMQMSSSLTDYANLSHFFSKVIYDYPNIQYTFSNRHDDESLTLAISQWLESRKLRISPSDICITTGIIPLLSYALRSCLSRKDVVAIESPGNSHFYFAAKLYGVEIVPIKSNPQTGLDVDHLQYEVEHNPRIRCVICAPNFSIPTGSLMPLAQKQRLADFCEKHDIAIIEDDTGSDFSHGTLLPTPIKSINPSQVIYISGFENSMLHMYYISGGKYHQKISGFAELSQAYVPKMLQQAFAQYLQSSYAKKHIKGLRKQIQDAVSAVRQAVLESFPEGTVAYKPKGGRFLWVEMPAGCSSIKLLDEAEKLSISFSPGPIFSEGSSFVNCLRLNCSAVAQSHSLINGIYLLGNTASRLLESQITE